MSEPAEPGADLFGGAAPVPHARPPGRLQLTGVLARHAEVRSKPGPHGFVPVLCLELEDVGPGHHRVHAEHTYTEATRAEAVSWAARLRKGTHITVTSDMVDIRLTLPSVDFHVSKEESHQ